MAHPRTSLSMRKRPCISAARMCSKLYQIRVSSLDEHCPIYSCLSFTRLVWISQGIWHSFPFSTNAPNSTRRIQLDDWRRSKWFHATDSSEDATLYDFTLTGLFNDTVAYPFQEQVSTVFGWTALAAVVAFLGYFMKEIRAFFVSFFRSTYQVSITEATMQFPRELHCTYSTVSLTFYSIHGSAQPGATKSQRIDFSACASIVAYIPQISLYTLPYPLLACDVDGVDKVSTVCVLQVMWHLYPWFGLNIHFYITGAGWLDRSQQ